MKSDKPFNYLCILCALCGEKIIHRKGRKERKVFGLGGKNDIDIIMEEF